MENTTALRNLLTQNKRLDNEALLKKLERLDQLTMQAKELQKKLQHLEKQLSKHRSKVAAAEIKVTQFFFSKGYKISSLSITVHVFLVTAFRLEGGGKGASKAAGRH
jgi:conjugal transfer/entry exclusion protein